jgi:hypothetical protein
MCAGCQLAPCVICTSQAWHDDPFAQTRVCQAVVCQAEPMWTCQGLQLLRPTGLAYNLLPRLMLWVV